MDLSAVSSVLQTIGNLAQQEVTSLFGVDEQIESLERELRWMQSFLKVADARKADNELIRASVAEIRELAYDAEDVIETFVLKIASKRKSGFFGCIKRSACFLKEGCLLHQIKSEIDKIIVRLKELARQLQTYDVTKFGDHGEGASSSTERWESRRPYPHVVDDNIVGLDGDIKKLVSVLVEDGNECKVVSICGMGGLGKTTLAKKIYRHSQVVSHFNNDLVWVYVSQQYQKRKVWEDILSGLKSLDKDDKLKGDEQIAEKLFNLLKDRRFMVVLDDIWSIEAWDSLIPAFPITGDNHHNSKILLTSRNKEIVFHADPRGGCLHELQCLNHEKSWELFQNIAFSAANPTENRVDPKMKELGEGMVTHCAGLPIAIIVLGGILAAKDNSLNEWLKVSANVKPYLKRGKSHGLLLEDVLALSYDDLPPYLRPCFLYFSIFPEDYGIPMDRLIQLLVAEGIVSTEGEGGGDSGEIAEDVAESYLMELVERCMIQVRERDIATLKVKTFEMHDLMRDICLSKEKQENFVFIVDQSNASSLSTIRRVRRVSSHEFFWIQCIKSRNLRSLFFFDEPNVEFIFPQSMQNFFENHEDFSLLFCIVCSSAICLCLQRLGGIWRYVFNNFKLLRVLDYETDGDVLCKLPSGVGNLIHLRFLSLRDVGFLCSKLPSSLGNLRCLQTLDLRVDSMSSCSSRIHVPNVIWRMEQLRHLYLPEECSHKTKLKLGNLRNLQTLVNFNTKNCYLKDLINMTNIRVLVIQGPFMIEDFNEEELDKNPPIIQATYLYSLSILTNGARIDPRHLAHLLSSCASICVLNLDARISKLPEEHLLSSNLAFISLKSCKLEEGQMAKLEKLPSLRSLELHSGGFIGKEILCSAQGFPKLVSLTLDDLDNLEEWKVDEGAMPSLQRLEINKCKDLKMLPDGLKLITTLQEVKMKSMPKAFKDKAVEGGEDFYKLQHVPSVIFLNCDMPVEDATT